MGRSPREITNRVIELAEEEILSWEGIARECLCYLSEDDVSDMAHTCEWIIPEEEP